MLGRTANEKQRGFALGSVLKSVARLAVSAALVIGLLAWVGIDQVAARISRLPLWGIALSAALIAFSTPLHAKRWLYTLDALSYSWRWRSALRENWIGYFFNQLLPTSAGGDAVRIVRLTRAGVPFGHSTVSVIGERLIAVLASVALTLFSVPLLLDKQPSGPVTLIVVAIEIGAIVSIAALPFIRTILGRWVPGRPRVYLELALLGFLRPKLILKAAFASVGIHALVTLSYMSLAAGMGLDTDLLTLAIILQPVMLLSMLPLSFAGWGLREGAMVAALGILGIDPAASLTISLCFGVVVLLVSLPGAIFLMMGTKSAPPVRREAAARTAG